MYIEIDSEKTYAAIDYVLNGVGSDYLSDSDIECMQGASFETLLDSEVKHVEKYGRPITGNLYLGEKETTTIYHRLLVARILALPNIDEIVEYLAR